MTAQILETIWRRPGIGGGSPSGPVGLTFGSLLGTSPPPSSPATVGSFRDQRHPSGPSRVIGRIGQNQMERARDWHFCYPPCATRTQTSPASLTGMRRSLTGRGNTVMRDLHPHVLRTP